MPLWSVMELTKLIQLNHHNQLSLGSDFVNPNHDDANTIHAWSQASRSSITMIPSDPTRMVCTGPSQGLTLVEKGELRKSGTVRSSLVGLMCCEAEDIRLSDRRGGEERGVVGGCQS